jgi:hypothetical protein
MPGADDWPLEAIRFVGFYDIMGFRELVARDDSVATYRVVRAFRDAALEGERIAQSISAPDGSGRGRQRPPLLRFVQFSDSIVLFSRDSSPTCSLAITLASLKLFLASMGCGFLIRGAWARGNCLLELEHSIFFGPGYNDAYLLAESQQWFGVVEHESAQDEPGEQLREMQSDELPLTEPYLVPLKSGERTLSALAWPILVGGAEQVAAALASAGAAGKEGDRVRAYRDATIAFAAALAGKYSRT